MKINLRRRYLACFITALSAGVAAMPAAIAAESESANMEEIVIIGSRRAARSATDTTAPVDVIAGEELTRNASTDIQDLMRTAVPSYNVNAQPISDAATISRPANLRGLSPDNTLVLINGKRRHRGSVISFLGGGISDGGGDGVGRDDRGDRCEGQVCGDSDGGGFGSW